MCGKRGEIPACWPDLWPDSLTSPGVHKSGDPTLARLLAGDPVGVGWLAKEEGEDQE